LCASVSKASCAPDRPRTRDPALASSLRIGAVLQAIGFKPE
jgi:hypothetical protein